MVGGGAEVGELGGAGVASKARLISVKSTHAWQCDLETGYLSAVAAWCHHAWCQHHLIIPVVIRGLSIRSFAKRCYILTCRSEELS